jgi:hypothetical protein
MSQNIRFLLLVCSFVVCKKNRGPEKYSECPNTRHPNTVTMRFPGKYNSGIQMRTGTGKLDKIVWNSGHKDH